MRPQAPMSEGQRRRGDLHVAVPRRLGHLLPEILSPAGRAGFGDPGGVSTCRSRGGWKIFSVAGCFDGGCGS